MRFTVSPEQLKFFHTKGYLELEGLINTEEAASLRCAIEDVTLKSPGYPHENFFRSTPFIATLAKKKGWGHIASELLHKKPLRLKFDRFFFCEIPMMEPMDEATCAMILDLESKKGIFFKQFPLPNNLYNSDKNCYFLLVMTANYLPDTLNPIIIR